MTVEHPATPGPRKYAAADRAAVTALLGDSRPLDDAACHAHVSGDSAIDGVALWLEPPAQSDAAYLGVVLTPDPATGRRFYELALACAEDALERGYQRGYFTIKHEGLLRLLQRTFRIAPTPTGWEPLSGAAREWEVRVDVDDAIGQLRSLLGRPEGSAP